jgi:adenine phosphoribosyltransferase
MSSAAAIEKIRDTIRNIPDFPKPGIMFRDITPVLKDPVLFDETLQCFEQALANKQVEYIVGIESRGFILGAALAQRMKVGFVPARKMGKLPGLVERHKYDLEYGSDCIEMHVDAFPAGSRVALVDDLLATGGTALATVTLIQKLQGTLVSILFMIELEYLHGRQVLPPNVPIESLIGYRY